MRLLFGQLAMIVLTLSSAFFADAREDKFVILHAGRETYTNVVVVEKTATHIFIQHNGGTATVKLGDLDAELQLRYHYDAGKAKEIAAANRAYVPPTNTVTRDYQVPDSGILSFTFPNAWKDSTFATPGQSQDSMTIRFERVGNGDFLALVSTVPGGPRTRGIDIRQAMITNARRYLPFAEETSTPLHEFGGPQTQGEYFSITNRSDIEWPAGAENFKYQTQGLVKIGETAFSFTIFSNVPNTSDQKAALDMVRAARYTGAKPGLTSAPAEFPK
jgi:hypothetical protein